MSSRLMDLFRTALLPLAVVLGLVANAGADEYDDAWGPASGSRLPMLEAPDQAGEPQRFETLRGKRGLLLFMNRSTDW